MSYLDTLYNRYLDQANQYAQSFGLDPQSQNDGAWDAFRHAYASAAVTDDYGKLAAHMLGDVNEIHGDYSHDQLSYAKHMDRWNNAAGRALADGAADEDEIARRTYDAFKKGDLIIDPAQDARYYKGPTLVPSPYDFDSNHFYRGPIPPRGAVAAIGPPSPTLGSNPHQYYAPYFGGRADIPAPQDHPLSQQEIERMRQANGIPKGGLF